MASRNFAFPQPQKQSPKDSSGFTGRNYRRKDSIEPSNMSSVSTMSRGMKVSSKLATIDGNLYAMHIHARLNKSPQPVFVSYKISYEWSPGDGALAEEIFSLRSSLAARQPEAALMCAVLEDAVDCFQNQFICATRRAKRLGGQAEEWLFSDDSKWAFSFLSICTALDLGPQYIRRGLKRWAAQSATIA